MCVSVMCDPEACGSVCMCTCDLEATVCMRDLRTSMCICL